MMDDSILYDELLQLTMRRQAGDATEEDLARLERLLGDSQQAIVYYIKIVEDGLTMREAAETRRSRSLTADLADDDGLPPQECEVLSLREYVVSRSASTVRSIRGSRLAAACLALVALGGALWLAQQNKSNDRPQDDTIARIVNVSGVEWAKGAEQFNPWSHIAPGDRLEFRRGMMNLFINSGVELLVEGPAEMEFASLDRVIVTEGKLAARVGPDAIGFQIDTPHANVIDRGTVFGITVDSTRQTDVMVYDGIVDLDVVGQSAQPRRRLATGEALRVNNHGDLSRIASVHGDEFLPPPQVRAATSHRLPVIQSVVDNIRQADIAKCNRVVASGFDEDCRAYVDREHEWNGVDQQGIPKCLLGGDYVMTFNEDKTDTSFELTLHLAQPANVYVLVDNRVPPPDWLAQDFVDTGLEVGLDEVHKHVNMDLAVGPGQSLDQTYSVWHRQVTDASSILLGPLGREPFAKPARVVQRGMYGIVATALEPSRVGQNTN
jgi:hypothetical protein